ncbi:MAG: Txe/YoeB family addiction module toxin [Desulfomicrobium sp.]|nr:Txe/YoeB family addiction module toxin [Desulfomicrobium sp.]
MLIWHDSAWEEYVSWQKQDKKTLKRINGLLKEILRDPYVGTGKPEPLKGNLSGFWSRRIDEKNRLVYRIVGDDCQIAQCRCHYDG